MISFHDITTVFSVASSDIPVVEKVLYGGTRREVVIRLKANSEFGFLVINGFIYPLIPDELPTQASLQHLLRYEAHETYLAVVEMLTELAE